MAHCLALLVLVHAGQTGGPSPPAFSGELRARALAATVRVINASAGLQGSGVVLARKGRFAYILTAHHLVRKAGGLKIATFSARAYPKPDRVYPPAEVEVVAVAADVRDLALVRVTVGEKGLTALSLCPAAALPGAGACDALAAGCSDGEAPTCLPARVLRKKRIRREAAGGSAFFWEVGGAYAEGRSGGPLLDRRGYLLGVLSGTSNGASYFCHTEEIRAFLKLAGVG